MVGMAVGVLCGGAMQLAVQLPALWRLGWRPAVVLDVRHEKVVEVFKLMGPAVLGAAAVQLNIFINSNYASHLGDRPVSWLNYAFRFMQFPIGVFGVSIAAAALPQFARATANKAAPDLAGLRAGIAQSVTLACGLCVPAAVGLALLGEPLLALLFEYGRFRPEDTAATAAALSAYSVGLTGYAAIKVLQPALLALDDARTPMLISLFCVGVNLVTNHVLIHHFGLGHVGLALTTSVSALLNAALLAAVLSRRAGGMGGARLASNLARIGLGATVMGAAVWGVLLALDQVVLGRWLGHAARLGVGGAAGVLSYALMMLWLRVEEFTAVVAVVRRRLGEKGAGR